MAKSSPLKGADPVLVQWAYKATGDELYQKYVQDHHNNMMSLAERLRSWDFGTGAQRIIDANGRLPQGEINGVREQLSGGMREEYIAGDNAKKEELTAEVAKMHADMTQYGQLRQTIANHVLSDNLSKGFLRTPQGQEILELMKNQTRLTKKKCPEGQDDCDDKGSLGIMMTDHKLIADITKAKQDKQRQINNLERLYQTGAVYGDGSDLYALYDELREFDELIKASTKKWTSISEIANSIQIVDQGAIDLIASTRNAAYQKGKDLLPEDNAEFQREKAGQIVKDVIMKGSNMTSLIYDPMFGDKSFYDNLVEHIQGNTYAQFGINDATVWDLGDLDQDGVIDEKEAQLIANEFIGTDLDENEDLQREMQEYLVNHLEKNYNLGKEERRDSYLKEEKDKKVDYSYAVDEDGNYIPSSQRDKEEDVETKEENVETTEQKTEDVNDVDETDLNDTDEDKDEDEEEDKDYHVGPSGKKYY